MNDWKVVLAIGLLYVSAFIGMAATAPTPKEKTYTEAELSKRLADERVKWEAEARPITNPVPVEPEQREDAGRDGKLQELATEHADRALAEKQRQVAEHEARINETIRRSRVMFLPEAEREAALASD